MSANDDNKTLSLLKSTSVEKLKKSESQSIIINFFSSTVPQRKDKDVQTEYLTSSSSEEGELPATTVDSGTQFSVKQKDASCTTTKDCASGKVKLKTSPCCLRIPSLIKVPSHLNHLESDEKEKETLMESRKQNSEKQGNKLPSNKQSDLERRRLEAELKAAEEIAKLRQTIIEKRLALELASIDDYNDFVKMSPTGRNSLQAELRALEEIAMRKQSLIETNLAQEMEQVEYQRFRGPPALPPPMPPPPPPLPLPPPALMQHQRQISPSPLKSGAYKTESTSSVLNPIRSLGRLEKKLNLDRKFSGDPGTKSQVAPVAYPIQYGDPRMLRDNRYYGQMPDPSVYDYQKAQGGQGKTHSAWKSAVAKIKNKIRNKSGSNGWNGE